MLRKVGVLGGMGPLATIDFMQKVIGATGATRDQDHVPMIVHSIPQIPDRTEAISAGTDAPFRGLLEGIRVLERSGAELIVIPCNTAHAWFDRLAAASEVRFLHVAEAVREHLEMSDDGLPGAIALMATRGTVRAGFYQRWLRSPSRTVLAPQEEVQEDITASIAAVKAGDVGGGRELASRAAHRLLDSGATRLLLACTELPVAMAGTQLASSSIDATTCLAMACVSFSAGFDGRADRC